MAIEEKDENGGGEVSVEQIFETHSIPSWREQLTVRAFVVSLILGFFFSFIVMKLNLTVGIIPSLNVSAGMLGYFLVTVYTKVLAKFGMLKHPFTRQENTVIQTCVVATSGIAFSGGFGSYLFGMSDIIAKQTEEANTAQNTKTLQLGWIIGFLFAVSFVGLFSVVPLRKVVHKVTGNISWKLNSVDPNMAFAKSNYQSISSLVSFILTVFACGARYLLLSAIDHRLEHVPKIKPYWSILAIQYLSIFPLDWTFAIMIIDHKLIYPSGTATAHLINSFHTPQGAKLVKRQVYALFKCFVFSFLWAFFQWFYTAGDNCGFAAFPTLGLKAYQNKFYFDFSATYVGVGMICPYIVNISLLAGSVLSWGIMWPLIAAKKGDWYSDKLSASSLHGLQGYKVFISIAMILGDGLYNFCAMLVKTARDVSMNCLQKEATSVLPLADRPSPNSSVSFDDMRRKEIFVKDQIPMKLAFLGYALLAVASIIAVPHIFPQLKWYHILVTYIFAPVLAFCNAYGCGLTDWSLASSYGKLAIVLFGAWVGLGNGGVLAGLASCGVMMSIVSTASDLMQDFKTGYLTLASPRSMFISQVIGTAMGCVIGPAVFWIFYKAYNVGVAGSEYPAPYATVYRGIALLGVEGLGSLPKNCLTLCIIFFIAAFLLSATKDFAKHMKWRVQHFLPSAMAMAIPFFIGSYFSIDMCLGSLILFLWRKFNLRQAEAFAPAVASGMICGEGIWSLPSSILSLAKVKPPICMKFLSRSTNAKVDAFLSG